MQEPKRTEKTPLLDRSVTIQPSHTDQPARSHTDQPTRAKTKEEIASLLEKSGIDVPYLTSPTRADPPTPRTPRSPAYAAVPGDEKANPTQTKKSNLVVRICKGFWKGVFAVGYSGANAINAFVAPSKLQPLNLFSANWWNIVSSSPLKLVESIANLISSSVVNLSVSYTYLPQAGEKLSKDFSCRSKKDAPKKTKWQKCGSFLAKLSTLFLGSSAAVSTAAIAYAAFLWGGIYTAGFLSVFNLGVNFVTRYVGVKSFFSRVRGFFDKDVQDTKKCIDALSRIKKKYFDEVNTLMAKIVDKNNHQYDEESLQEIFAELGELMKKYPDLMDEKSHAYLAYLGLVFDLSFATFIFTFVLPTFLQKGFDGPNDLGTFLTKGTTALKEHETVLDTLPLSAKLSIGAFPGVASALFYWINAFDLRSLAYSTYCEVKNNLTCGSASKLAVVIAANYFASPSMSSVAENILAQKNMLLPFLKEDWLSSIYTITNRLGCFAANTPSCLKKAFPTYPVSAEGLAKKLRGNLGYAEKPKKDVMAAIRSSGLLSEPPRREAPKHVMARQESVLSGMSGFA